MTGAIIVSDLIWELAIITFCIFATGMGLGALATWFFMRHH